QPVKGLARNVTLVPLDTNRFDLDVIQRLHHGTTVIHCDPYTSRSTLCMLKLDATCGLLSWHKVGYLGTKETKDKDAYISSVTRIQNAKTQSTTSMESGNPPSSPSLRPAGAACTMLECGFLKLSYVKSVENVDSHDINIESIYRRYCNEKMSVQMHCWAINFGCYLSDNEFLYFIAPEKSAQCWITGLTAIVNYFLEQQKCADRRVLWLRKLYLQLCTNYEQDNVIDEGVISTVQPREALQAFGGRAREWRGLGLQSIVSKSPQSGTNRPAEVTAAKGRLKQMTSAVTRQMKFANRSSAHPQPFISLKAQYQSVRNRIAGRQFTVSDPSISKMPQSHGSSSSVDTISLSSWYKSRRLSARTLANFWSGKTKKTKSSENASQNPAFCKEFLLSSKSCEGEYSEKPVTLFEFIELYKSFNANMRTDLKDIFNDFLVTYGCGNANAVEREKNQIFSQIGSPLLDTEFIPNGS
ncbi:hypothetical protein WUBG_12163, partial [Wuchereria bancrofti]